MQLLEATERTDFEQWEIKFYTERILQEKQIFMNKFPRLVQKEKTSILVN